MLTAAQIQDAFIRIKKHTVLTPLLTSDPMSARCGSQILVKTEHRQRTGSFKIRGALNAVLSLDDDVAERGITTASSGNHGIAFATAANIRGCDATVYLPTGASEAKTSAIRRLGSRIVFVASTDTGHAEAAARADAKTEGRYYVSPYNDPAIIAGQGTIGLEIVSQVQALGSTPLDAVVVSVGGGGLVSGIATWLEEHSPNTKVIGASPRNDMAMAASVAAGHVVDPPTTPTLSDGTAGAIETDAITFPICQRLVSDWITPSEAQIATAVTAMIDDHHELVEGAAGVALAAAALYGQQNPGSTIVVVSCGANISSLATRSALELARQQ